MAYKHKIVQGIADLVEKYGGESKDPMMRAIWFGIKGQVPNILQSLDENEEAVTTLREKLIEVLDLKPQEPEVISEVAELEVGVEPEKESTE